HELAVVVGREHDDAHGWVELLDLARGLQPVHLGHSDVEEDDVRLPNTVLHDAESLATVRGLAHYLDVSCHLQVATQALTDERVIVGDDDPYGHTSSIGSKVRGLKS